MFGNQKTVGGDIERIKKIKDKILNSTIENRNKLIIDILEEKKFNNLENNLKKITRNEFKLETKLNSQVSSRLNFRII